MKVSKSLTAASTEVASSRIFIASFRICFSVFSRTAFTFKSNSFSGICPGSQVGSGFLEPEKKLWFPCPRRLWKTSCSLTRNWRWDHRKRRSQTGPVLPLASSPSSQLRFYRDWLPGDQRSVKWSWPERKVSGVRYNIKGNFEQNSLNELIAFKILCSSVWYNYDSYDVTWSKAFSLFYIDIFGAKLMQKKFVLPLEDGMLCLPNVTLPRCKVWRCPMARSDRIDHRRRRSSVALSMNMEGLNHPICYRSFLQKSFM